MLFWPIFDIKLRNVEKFRPQNAKILKVMPKNYDFLDFQFYNLGHSKKNTDVTLNYFTPCSSDSIVWLNFEHVIAGYVGSSQFHK